MILSKDTLKNLVKYDPGAIFNIINCIEKSVHEPLLINETQILVNTWINQYLIFNNYRIEIDLLNDWIQITMDKNTYIVCRQLDLNLILFSSVKDTNDNNVYKYTFTKLAVKLLDQKEKFKQLSLTDREKCTVMLCHIYLNLFCKSNDYQNHTSVDIDSIIGDHVIESDRLRIETLSCNLGANHQLVSIKKSLLDKKINFQKQYKNLLHLIESYQKKIFDICEKITNKTHGFDKNIYSSLKSLAKTPLKGIELFCQIVANDTVLLFESLTEEIIHPAEFINKYKPVVTDLIDQVVRFNTMGCTELKSITTISQIFTRIVPWDQMFQSIHEQSDDPIRSIFLDARTIIESINKLVMIVQYESELIGIDKDTEEYYLSSQLIIDDFKDFFAINNIKLTDQTFHNLVDQYPFLSKYISEIIVSNTALRYNSVGLITGATHGLKLSNIDKISISCPKILQNIFLNLSRNDDSEIKSSQDLVSREITDLITEYTRKFITDDIYLSFQILLLYDTIKYIESIIEDSDKTIEYHIKGGFCRDIILRYLSLQATPPLEKTFKKSIKDIDVAMNIDPEIFTFYLCKISVERYNYIPIKRWNNAEKTEKGKNISVWSVKLIEEYEPMEFVHFRSDQYDPETSEVIAEDRLSSLEDDMRRDVPWPSFCLNTMAMVDYFDIIGMLNRGQHIIRTPPPYDAMYQNKSNESIPANISESQINYQTHIETSDRILRLFKFITDPFDRWFAYNYDSLTKQFLSVNKNGFTVDPRLFQLYTEPITETEIESLKLIHRYIRRWFENGLMSNVFKSIIRIPTLYPHRFVQLLDQFKLIDVLFFNNYNIEMFLTYTDTLEKMIGYSGVRLSIPYQILGLGVRDTNEMLRQMKLLSLSNTTQTMALILAKYGKLLFDRSVDTEDSYRLVKQSKDVQNFVLEILSGSTGSYYFFHCVELIRLLGFNLNEIDPEKYKSYMITKKIREKYNICVANIMGDYVGMIALSTQTDKHIAKKWFGEKIIEHAFAMISRTISVAGGIGPMVMFEIDRARVIQQKTVNSISKNVTQSMKIIIDNFNEMNFKSLQDIETRLINILDRLFVLNTHIDHKSIIGPIFNHIDVIVDRLKLIMISETELTYLKQMFTTGTVTSRVDSIYSYFKINKFDLIDFDINVSLPTTITSTKIAEKYFAETTKYYCQDAQF